MIKSEVPDRQPSPPDDLPSPFVHHLGELRRRLLLSFAALGAAAVASYVASGPLLDLLLSRVRDAVDSTYFFSPYEAFLVRFKVALFFGVLVSSPFWIWQAWSFLKPALYARERSVLVACFWASLVLFLSGAAFAFFGVVPGAFRFFMGFGTPTVRPLLSVGRTVGFVSTLVLGFGLAFDFPVVILGLVRAGVVSVATLRKFRKAAIVLSFLLAAVLTPTTDLFTQIFLAVPLCLLYEVSLLAARLVRR